MFMLRAMLELGTGYMTSAQIRTARREDAATILRLIRELAEFENLLEQVRASEEDILRDGFGPAPRFECLLAELDGEAVGFALFFYNYSTFEGRAGLYLEDIYISPTARDSGLGRAMMTRLAGIAVERGCARFDLWVLHWNPARPRRRWRPRAPSRPPDRSWPGA